MSFFHDTYSYGSGHTGHIFRLRFMAVAFHRWRFTLYLLGRRLVDL